MFLNYIQIFTMKQTVLFISFIFLGFLSFAQLSISSGSVDYVIDFESDVIGVNSGEYTGDGFNTTPGNGQLDANAWACTGLSDGDADFGDINESGDFARGEIEGDVEEGGFYSFYVYKQGNNVDHAFGFQPTADDFTPGTVTLKVVNNSGKYIIEVDIAYEVWTNNDGNFSTACNFSYSLDNSNFEGLAALNFESKQVSTEDVILAKPKWEVENKSITIRDIAIAPEGALYLRWETDDIFGEPGDKRDEFALDDITVNATTAVNPPPIYNNITFYEYPTTSETVEVSANITDANGTVNAASVKIKYGNSEGGPYGSEITMSNGGSGSIFSGTLPVQAAEGSIYFIIEALDNESAIGTSVEQSYVVRNPVLADIPYEESFETEGSLGDCYVFNAKGDSKEWYQYEEGNGSKYRNFANVSGFNSEEEEEDWLILPGFDLNIPSIGGNFVLTFEVYYNFGSDDVGSFDLLYSSNYSGTGSPNAEGVTWNTLSFSRPTGYDFWYYSDNVVLPFDVSDTVYVAFKYANPNYSYRTWRIDNISVVNDFIADPEPTNYPTDFRDSVLNGSAIELFWTDALADTANGETFPWGYQIQAKTTDKSFVVPVDGVRIDDDLDLRDGYGVRNIFHGGFESVTFTGLDASTQYDFIIYPYSNSGVDINYKTDGTPPTTSGTTEAGSNASPGDVIITEFMSDPNDVSDSDGEWFELFNTTDSPIDLDGWVIESSGSGLERHTILREPGLIIGAKDFVVLGLNSDTLTNGGVPVDYAYYDVFLSNTFDTLRITTDADVVMDFIEWGDGAVWENQTARSLYFIGVPGEDNNNGNKWIPALIRENGYIDPEQTPANIIENDLGSPGTNGLFQNLVDSTTWIGDGEWSVGNRVGQSNWTNGAPGIQVQVSVKGDVSVDLPANFPAQSGKLIIDPTTGSVTIPPNRALTTK